MGIDKKVLLRELDKEFARRDFFHYCHLMNGEFYKENRWHLKHICKEMQDFYESDEHNVLVVNLPPRA